jgi:TRAP-type uncharacterized transport system substrate-binding protein
MKKIINIAAIITTLTTPVLANDAKIIAGASESGGYYAKAQIASQKLNQRGYDTIVTSTNGSDEITLGICNGKFLAGYTQIDAIFKRAKEGCSLRPVSTYGNEIAFMMIPPKSDIDELSDLNESNKVLVNTIGSGAALFWETIVSIENGDDGNKSDWAKAKPVNENFSMAGTLAQFGDIDAVVMVSSLDNPNIETLLSIGWQFAELYDKDINDQMFNDNPLYEYEKIKTRINDEKHTVKGYIVKSFGVVSEKTARDREIYTDVSRAMQ